MGLHHPEQQQKACPWHGGTGRSGGVATEAIGALAPKNRKSEEHICMKATAVTLVGFEKGMEVNEYVWSNMFNKEV